MNFLHLPLWLCLFLFTHSQMMIAENNKIDSLHTAEYISSIYISKPQRALQLLNEAETGETIPPNILHSLRSSAYRSMNMWKAAFNEARKSYILDSVSQENPPLLLETTIALAELSHLLSQYKESMRYAIQGITLAQEMDDVKAKSKLLFCIGENKRFLSFKEESYEYFNEAIKLLQKADDLLAMRMLSYFYGLKMGYLIDDAKYKEVQFIGLERKKLIDKMKDMPGIREGYIDQQYAYLYSKLVYAYYMEGQYAQAEESFRQYRSTHAASTPDGRYDAVPYLLFKKQYHEVIDICNGFKRILQKQDTLNYQYRSILQNEIKAYKGLNDYENIARLRESIIAITDSVNAREKQNAALELDAVYKANEKDEYIAQQAFQLKIRNISLLFFICIMFLTTIFLWRLWKHNRIIKYKNKILTQHINEQISTKEGYDKMYDESLSEANSSSDNMDSTDEESTAEERAENKLIFERLNSIIIRDKLYLSPELSRDDLSRMVRLNNAHFARMIKENTGTNLNGYINNLRLKYAILLLKKHPNYTIKAIAEDSGFNSMPTFHNLFKKKTGMTPFEFKRAQEELK